MKEFDWIGVKFERIVPESANSIVFLILWVKEAPPECYGPNVTAVDNKSISRHILTLLKYARIYAFAQCGNPPQYESFIWKMPHARPCMLLWWCMQRFPAKPGVSYPKPKMKPLPSHTNNDTVPGCWRSNIIPNAVYNKEQSNYAARNLQLVVKKKKRSRERLEWFLPVHGWDRDILRARRTVLFEVEW